MIRVSDDDFSIDEVILHTRRPSMGAVVMFLGTVRDISTETPVEKLEFEADNEMAVKELEQIRQEIIDRFGVTDVSIIHRTGVLNPGENILLIAAGAAHRDQAFKGCRYAIEELKKRALIWKKEFFEGESHWVGEQNNE